MPRRSLVALVLAGALLLVGVVWIAGSQGRGRALYSRAVAYLGQKRFDRLYAEGVSQYQAGDFEHAIETFKRADALIPNVIRTSLLLGWSNWRLGRAQEAESYFSRILRIDRSVESAQMGLAYTSLALQKPDVALPLFQELARIHPEDHDLQMSLGDAFVQSGQNLAAALHYRTLLDHNPQDQDAQREFLGLYGYPSYRPDLPMTPSPIRHPDRPEVYFRARGDYLWARVGNDWKRIFSVGVNIGPARPNEFPPTSSRQVSTYLEWLKQIAAMNSNTVRVYTELPPAFYQALKSFNETAPSPLWLIQEVWIDEGADNLYDPATEKEFRRDLQYVIDLLHGQGDIPYRRGHSFGIYTADVSRWVLGLGVGREVEPRLVIITNRKNPNSTSYHGKYVSLPARNATEAWFARMCDLAATYEVQKYNAQRPLTVVNWPPLDPMTHPSEGSYADELRIRKSAGEDISEEIKPETVYNDMDTVSIDVTKFKAEPEFQAGLFALYHVYTHWPDFLLHEPSYALAKDSEGSNRYFGYLLDLKKAHPNFPLLIGEYGISTSLGLSHLHPDGWNNGGLNEKQQAELLVRFTKNIRDSNCAGAIVFEWQDEWFKHVGDLDTADFELPLERGPYWFNVLDAEKSFGIVAYEPNTPVPLLRGNRADWQDAKRLYSADGGGNGPGELQAIDAKSDFSYLYVLLSVKSGAIDWHRRRYWVALNTLPGQSGSRVLPEIGVRLESGANFLIELNDPFSGRILIADNYNPNQRIKIPGNSGRTRMWRKRGMQVEIADSAPFAERITEANMTRYAKDGRVFPSLDYNRSAFPYGTADRQSAEYSNHALWHADGQQGMIELRIPWGFLLMMDPSKLQAFGGTDANRYTAVNESWMPLPKETPGVSVAAFALALPAPDKEDAKALTSSLPAVGGGKAIKQVPVFTWQKWNEVQYRPYFKPSYYALQKTFAEMTKTAEKSSPASAER